MLPYVRPGHSSTPATRRTKALGGWASATSSVVGRTDRTRVLRIGRVLAIKVSGLDSLCPSEICAKRSIYGCCPW
jgi:hypothetical protein